MTLTATEPAAWRPLALALGQALRDVSDAVDYLPWQTRARVRQALAELDHRTGAGDVIDLVAHESPAYPHRV